MSKDFSKRLFLSFLGNSIFDKVWHHHWQLSPTADLIELGGCTSMNGSTAQSLQPRLWLQMRSQAQMAARIFWLHCFNSGSRQQTARLFNVFVCHILDRGKGTKNSSVLSAASSTIKILGLRKLLSLLQSCNDSIFSGNQWARSWDDEWCMLSPRRWARWEVWKYWETDLFWFYSWVLLMRKNIYGLMQPWTLITLKVKFVFIL